MFVGINAFLKSVDVVENELLSPAVMPAPFGPALMKYYDTLDRYRLLTYGQQIARAVEELQRPRVAASVLGDLKHLIVDEYQDINPAQERLIELLAGPEVEVCVVGDDDQAIYQWRGSDVSNIVEFTKRYPSVATFKLTKNFRSRPQIIDVANGFAKTIPKRLPKTMSPDRSQGGSTKRVVSWAEVDEATEARLDSESCLGPERPGRAFPRHRRARSRQPRLRTARR